MRVTVIVERSKKPIQLRWDVGPVSEQILSGPDEEPLMLTLTDTQQCALSVKPVNKKGNAAQVQSPVWSSSDATVATVTADATDPLKALVVALAGGATQINVTADADLGDGVVPISAVLDVSVLAGLAVSLGITTGAPEEQP